MDYPAKKAEFASETVSAVFIIAFVSLFILVNLFFGFVWPLFILAMGIGFFIAVKYPRSGILASIFLTMVFERFFTLQSFFVGKTEYKLYPLDVILLGVLAGIIFQVIFQKKKIILEKADKILVGFIGWNFVYFIFSVFISKNDAALAFSTFKNYAFYGLLYFAAVFLFQAKEDIGRLFKFFLAGATAITIFIIIGILRGQGLWSEFTPLSTGGARTLAFTHGLYLTLAFVPALLGIVFGKLKKSGWLYFLMIMWLIGIVGTMMRHLWIALVIALVAVYVFLPKKNKIEFRQTAFGFLAPVAIAIILLGYFMVISPNSALNAETKNVFSAVTERTTSLANVSADESFAWRSLVWNSAYAEFKQNPLLGTGTGKRIYAETKTYKDFIEVRNIHNSFLAIMIQLGIAGLGLFVWFVYHNMKNLLRFSSADVAVNFYKFSVFGVLVMYLAVLPFQPYLETNLLSIFFWLTLGLARIIPKTKF